MQDTEPIKLRADLKFSAAEKLTELYKEILESDEEEVNIDATRVYWVSPFTACWFAALYDQIKLQGKVLNLIEPNRDNAVHQWHNLGISKYLGFSRDIISLTNLPAFPVTRLIEPSYPLAGRVTRILTANLKGAENFHKALHFAIRETIDNTFDHGITDKCFVCAYSVPTRNIVRLCILDYGIGIPNSMRSSKEYSRLDKDSAAVIKAMELGVSSKPTARGIGLYLLKDTVQKNEGSSLSIRSGRALVTAGKKSNNTFLSERTLDSEFNGTVIKVIIRKKERFQYISVSAWEEL